MYDLKRNASVELLRLSMMFGIVLLHVITQDGYFPIGGFFTKCVTNVLSTCVVGFVFISGYFGVRMAVMKITRLCSLAAFYAFLLGAVFGWRTVIDRFTHDWFLWGYVVLMLFAPLFNAAVEVLDWRKVMGALFAVYVWSYLCVIPGFHDFMPCPKGFAPLSFFTMFGIYISARLYRKYDIEFLILRRKWMSMIIIVLSMLLVLVGFYHHNSIASLALIGTAFAFIKNKSLPCWFSNVVLIVAPTTFGIYLIHSSCLAHYYRKELLDELVAIMPTPAAWFVAALIVYCVSASIDLLRRKILALLVWVRKCSL